MTGEFFMHPTANFVIARRQEVGIVGVQALDALKIPQARNANLAQWRFPVSAACKFHIGINQ